MTGEKQQLVINNKIYKIMTWEKYWCVSKAIFDEK